MGYIGPYCPNNESSKVQMGQKMKHEMEAGIIGVDKVQGARKLGLHF